MFEPKTFWEKRVAALETLVLNLCQAANMMGLVGNWHHQIEAIKGGLVEELLGPVVADGKIDPKTIFETGRAKLVELGLILNMGDYTSQEAFDLDLGKRSARLLELPNLDEVIGPDYLTTPYSALCRVDVQIGQADAEYAPALVIRQGDILNIFMFSDESMSPMQLCLAQMPKDFPWGGPNQHAWRSEIYPYRGDLLADVFSAGLGEAAASIDFTALNERLDAEIAEAAAAATAEAEAAANDFIAPPTANDAVILEPTSANDDVTVTTEADVPAFDVVAANDEMSVLAQEPETAVVQIRKDGEMIVDVTVTADQLRPAEIIE